ncbi:hypothetical protein WSS_A33505 [Rhodococcus opacus M213]|uniref:Uncharacterized protein n=1 Tax=Rhodococcus opacus M213 TaxID=1129896 RepID=K8XBT1_RHOOP|nr:hypothetical protein WSS_A33505 [Rhodococcus opacus M213]
MAVVADRDSGAVRGEAVAAMVIWAVVTMSITSAPSTRVTMTCADASSGGTEYRLPRNDTGACRDAVRGSVRIAGYGVAGSAVNGSAAATVATEALPSAVALRRVSPRSRQNSSRRCCACSTVTSSGRVRDHRWAAV